MKKMIIFSLVALFSSLAVRAQHEGELTQDNVQIEDCNYASVTVLYKVGHFFGEPTVNGVYKATGSADCKIPPSTTIWLKIAHTNGQYGYIRVSPTTPKVNEGYGFNFTGSPNWDDFICQHDGNSKGECFDKETAKTLYKEGSITSFEVSW